MAVNASTQFQEILKEFGSLAGKDFFKGSVQSVSNLTKQIESARGITTEMVKKNLVFTATSLDKVTRNIEAAAQEQVSMMRGNLKALQKAQEEQNHAEINRLEAVIRETQTRYDALNRQQQTELNNALKFYKQSEKAYKQQEERLTARRDKIEELGKVGAVASQGLEGLEKALTGFTGSLQNLDSLAEGFKSGGEALSKGLRGLQARAAKKAEDSGGGIIGGLSVGLGKLSTAALAITAVVGGALAIFKVMQGLEEKVKEFNKGLIDTVGVNDLLLDGTQGVGESLAVWRKAFTDADFANSMGMTLDEIKALPGALKSANLIVRDFGGSLFKMKDFIFGAKAAAVSLGVSFETALERSTYFKEELGIIGESGDLLNKISEEFANIRDMALQSGYSTDAFYQKIKSLTDGMENMNNRTEEAGRLLLSFTRVLGAKGANAFLTSMGAGLGGEGYTELIKRQMLTGRKRIVPILQTEAEYMHKVLSKDYQKALGEADTKTILARAGLVQFGIDMEKDMKSLQQMTIEQQEDLVSSLLANKTTEGLGREIQKLITVAKGSKQGATGGQVSTAMGELGATGSIALKYAQLEAHLAGKSIDSMTDIQKLALEQLSGLSKEQIEQFRVIQRKMRGDLRYARSLATSGREITKEQTERLEKMGLKVEGGRILSKDRGSEVKTETDYLLAQREALESIKEKTDAYTQEALLQDVAENTLTSADMINNHLGEILMNLSSYVVGIFNFMDKETTSEDKTTRDAILGELAAEIKTLNAQNQDEAKQVRQIESKMAKRAAELAKKGETTDYDEEYQKLKQDKENTQKDIETRKNKSEVLKRQRTLIRSGEFSVKGKIKGDILSGSQVTAASQLAGEGIDIGLSPAAQETVKDLQTIRGLGFASMDEMVNYLVNHASDDDPRSREVENFLTEKGYTVAFQKEGATHLVGSQDPSAATISPAAATLSNSLLKGAVLMKGGNIVHATEGARLTKLDALGQVQPFELSEGALDARVQALRTKQEAAARREGTSVHGTSTPIILRTDEELKAEAERQLYAEGELLTAKGGVKPEDIQAAFAVTPSERVQEAKDDAKGLTPLNPEVRTATIEMEREAAKKIAEDERSRNKADLLTALKLGSDASNDAIYQALQTRPALGGLAQSAGFFLDDPEITSADDLYVSKYGVFKLNPRDLPSMLGGGVAFTKPGGAVDQLAKGMGMNIGTVTIHVDGSKSPEETGKAVVGELLKLKKRKEGKAI